MHFHYCGNPFHDVFMNLVALLASLPDWMPFVTAARARRGR